MSRATRSDAIITSSCAGGCGDCASASRGDRPLRPPCVHRQRTGSREGAGAKRRTRLDRQAHQSDRSRCRLLFFSRRNLLDIVLPADGPSARIAARAAHVCPPARPARSSRPTGSTRGAASPISPSSSRVRFRRNCAPRSATGSTAATTASWCARGTNSRGRRGGGGLRPRHGLDRARLVDLVRLERGGIPRAHRGSAIRRIGHERWLRNIAVALGNAPHSPAVIAALAPAPTMLRRWCGSTWRGRWGARPPMNGTRRLSMRRAAPSCAATRITTSRVPERTGARSEAWRIAKYSGLNPSATSASRPWRINASKSRSPPSIRLAKAPRVAKSRGAIGTPRGSAAGSRSRRPARRRRARWRSRSLRPG